MKLTTRHFGEIEVDEAKIILFEEGIPGFEKLKRFALFHNEGEAADNDAEQESAFMWLQCIDDGDIAFVLINVYMFVPGYAPRFDTTELERLGVCGDDELIIRNIAVVPERMEDISVNLKAPVIINARTQKGRQSVVQNDEYHIRHHIFREIKEALNDTAV